MGTRHLTAVYCDGEYKIAQYGQWDGYPSGAGTDVLMFAQRISDPYNRNEFREKVRKCRWITDEEIAERNNRIREEDIQDWRKVWPELSRDTGAGILDMVFEGDGLALVNNIDFAADSLFCEWAWVIDLDKGTFEGYEGFNKEPLAEGERFSFLKDKEDGKYHGVTFVKAYDLNDLPDRKTFLEDFEDEDSEDG